MIRVQNALTEQREEVRFEALKVNIRNLAPLDERRMAFNNVDIFSQQFVNSCPAPGEIIGNTDLKQLYSDYYGLPGDQFKAHVGMRFNGRTLDRYGWALVNTSMTGGGWTKRHDSSKLLLAECLAECKVPSTCEVYGLFAACINQQGAINGEPARKRQSLVPDFMIEISYSDELDELKCSGQTKRTRRRCRLNVAG